MQLLRAATLTSPDIEAAVSRYEQWLGYRVVERGEVSPELALSWNTPGSGHRRYAVMQPESDAPVYLRLIEGAPHAAYLPLRTYGWAAVELCVKDVLEVNARLQGSPFEIIGPPRRLDGLPTIFPMQVRGPDQEVFFLTEIGGDLPEYDLPRAQSLIDRPFILVLACSDLRESLSWFERVVGLAPGRELELAYNVLSASFGMPADHKHRLATLAHERDCFLELDQYPAAATPRPGAASQLKPGAAIATFLHPSLESVPGPWLSPPQSHEGVIYDGRRAGTLAAPDDSLVELVEVRKGT